MRKTLAALGLVLALTGGAATAVAQEAAPDLRGTWTGTSESIVRGAPMHHGPSQGNAPGLDNVAFTMTISGQDGRRFWGTFSSKLNQEPIIGVVANDGKSFVMRDTDGLTTGTIVDANTMDMVYSHVGKSAVVSALRVTRKK
ncbi:MAG: hypothetical protein V4513_08450 [Pseudomonadota bacterium]